jgi:hypothetical protein
MRRILHLLEFLGEGAKPCEKITIHQLDELRLVLRIDFKSGGPFNIRPSNRRMIAHTFFAGASTTLLTKIRGIPSNVIVRRLSARRFPVSPRSCSW